MSETPKSKRGSKKLSEAGNKKPVKEANKKTAKVNKKPKVDKNNKPVSTRDDTKRPRENFTLTWVAMALVVVGVAVLVYASGFKSGDVAFSEPKTESAKSNVKTPIGGDFTLVDQEGNTVTNMDFRGQYLLIYFGYTYCPDVCPTSLTDMSDALEKLDSYAAKVTPILITIDPARDTPEHLKEYASFFHPQLRALTGSLEQIAAVAKAYRVYFSKTNQSKSADDDYLMDHSSVIYLMGPDGTFLSHFSHGTDAETMARRIRDIIF